MGNCVAGPKVLAQELREQFIRITRADGKILEFEPPMAVRDLLSDHKYEGHAVVSPWALCQALSPDHELVPGELYHLLPWHTAERCSHSDFEVSSEINGVGEDRANATSVSTAALPGYVETKAQASSRESSPKEASTVRLKVVITKQQLMALLAKDSIDKVQSLEDLVVQLQRKAKSVVAERKDSSSRMSNCGWRPALESIAEGCDEAHNFRIPGPIA